MKTLLGRAVDKVWTLSMQGLDKDLRTSLMTSLISASSQHFLHWVHSFIKSVRRWPPSCQFIKNKQLKKLTRPFLLSTFISGANPNDNRIPLFDRQEGMLYPLGRHKYGYWMRKREKKGNWYIFQRTRWLYTQDGRLFTIPAADGDVFTLTSLNPQRGPKGGETPQ